MTANPTLKIIVAAMLLFMITSLAQAHEWSGHLSLLAGGKILDDRDWPEINEHYSLGIISDVKEASWPVSIALDLMDTGGKHDHDGMEDLGHTAEIHLGVRKIFLDPKRKMQPYVGGGVALMYAEQEYEIESIKTTEDDDGVGGWFGVGTYYEIHPKFALGLDVRYSRGEVILFGQDRDAGGAQVHIIAGFQF
jgi:hypothetical protein